MTESTEAILIYPEHHTVWLEAMGITRWQIKEPLAQVTHSTNAVEKLLPNEPIEKNVAEQDAMPEALEATHSILTPQIEMAQYWVIGQQTLIPEEAYLLAGMMQAIGAQSVVFSHAADELLDSVMSTGLASWPRLVVQALPLGGTLKVPETVKILILGETPLQLQAKLWSLPSLSQLLAEPQLKREAWEILKKAKADVAVHDTV
jgi:DNA polymerase III psi subunit